MMPVSVAWTNTQQTVAQATVAEPWTWQDLFDADQQVRAMLEAVEHDVVVIVDFTRSHYVPPRPVAQLPRFAEGRHPREKALIVVGLTTTLGQIATQIFSRVYRHVRYADTPAAAQKLLEQLGFAVDTAE